MHVWEKLKHLFSHQYRIYMREFETGPLGDTIEYIRSVMVAESGSEHKWTQRQKIQEEEEENTRKAGRKRFAEIESVPDYP